MARVHAGLRFPTVSTALHSTKASPDFDIDVDIYVNVHVKLILDLDLGDVEVDVDVQIDVSDAIFDANADASKLFLDHSKVLNELQVELLSLRKASFRLISLIGLGMC